MRSGSNPNIDDDTRARARKFVESANAPKPRVTASPPTKKAPIVTKKMLADSGHVTLRDYLNAQRGLTRRKEFDPTDVDIPDRAGLAAADAIDPGADPKYGLGKFASKAKASTVAPEIKKSEEPPVQTPPVQTPQPVVSETKKQRRPRNLTDLLGITTPYKSGGSVSSRADGIAQRGKTRCKMY